jgi:hypothetical protein
VCFTVDIGFQFEIIWQDSDVIELRASGWNGLFCGAADVYVGAREREETVSKLQGFPNHPADFAKLSLAASARGTVVAA